MELDLQFKMDIKSLLISKSTIYYIEYILTKKGNTYDEWSLDVWVAIRNSFLQEIQWLSL